MPTRDGIVAMLSAVALTVAACSGAPGGSPVATSAPGCPFNDPTRCAASFVPGTPIPFATRAAPPSRDTSATMRIAVGACLRFAVGGPALEDIAALEPDLMLWLGDNIYADTEDPAVMRALYETLGANPRFQALAAITPMMAVWDDHDFGWNNANRTWAHRDEAKAEFLRFWGSQGDPRSSQPGVYSATTFGSGDRAVQVILLDNRYNLDPFDYAGEDPGRTILGAEQWAWLRERLAEPAAIRIIGSGIQVIQDYDIDTEWEGWGDSSLERERLFALIREMRVPGVVFVSGDMHFAELTRHPQDALGYPTYDLTPSGLDQTEGSPRGEWINPNRIGEVLNSNRKFGIVEIDWSTADPEIHLEIYDGARRHLDHVVRLSELQPAA